MRDESQHVVLGLYDRVNGTLRIIASRVNRGRQPVKTASGAYKRDAAGKKVWNDYRVRMFQTVIGPRHFDFMRAQRLYLSDAQRHDADVAGINPFARFDRGDDSELFHNIDMAAALAALGEAQKLLGADVAFMAVPVIKTKTRKRTKKSFFKKTVKVYLQGHVHPEWMMLVANNAGGYALTGGITSAFCAIEPYEDADGAGGNCPPHAVVAAPSVALSMEGGNLPAVPQQLAETLYAKKSGFSVLGMALIIAVVAAFGGALIGPEIFTLSSTAGVVASPPVAGALAGASIGFGGYLISSELINGAGPGDYQSAVYGRQISFGTMLDSADEFHAYAVGSGEYRGFGNALGRALHRKLATRAPEDDSLHAVSCFWAGETGATCGARGNAEDYNIRSAAKGMNDLIDKNAAKAEEARLKARGEARGAVAVSDDAPGAADIRAVNEMLDNGETPVLVAVKSGNTATILRAGEGRYVIVRGKDGKKIRVSAAQLRRMLADPKYRLER